MQDGSVSTQLNFVSLDTAPVSVFYFSFVEKEGNREVHLENNCCIYILLSSVCLGGFVPSCS